MLADFEPIEKGVGRIEPDREPLRDLFLLGALRRVHFVVASDHFRAPAPQSGHFANAFGGCAFAFSEKFSQQLIQPHEAHFGFIQCREMEKIAELLFVLAFGIRFCGHHHAHARFLEHADDVFRRSFSVRAEIGDQLPANLLDFSGRIAWLRQFARHFENQRFLCARFACVRCV